MSGSGDHDADHSEWVCLHTLHALAADEIDAVEARLAACPRCREERDALRRLSGAFVAWPTDVLRPPTSLWDRVARRIEAGNDLGRAPVTPSRPAEPDWEDAAPGITVKLLATDEKNRCVTMLVRLAPGAEYPPHVHAGVEELHLLAGELTINDRALAPGDYSRGEPGAFDYRVWSPTGCTCLLVTSMDDVLR